jgi:FkbH-like protein
VISRQEVISAFKLVLGRTPEERAIQGGISIGSLAGLLDVLLKSAEFRQREAARGSASVVDALIQRHKSYSYSAPTDLSVSSSAVRQVAFIGACFMESWIPPIAAIHKETTVDYYLFNNAASLPARTAEEIRRYSFQVIQIPLRNLLPEMTYMKLFHNDNAGFEVVFEAAKERMRHLLHAALAWHREHGLLTFVCNYMVPQQNPMGRLQAKNDLRNMAYFVRRLNDFLVELIADHPGAYLLDVDEQSAIAGKQYIQDDSVWLTVHGAMLNDWDRAHDADRIHPIGAMSRYYDFRVEEFVLQLWSELCAMYRTVRSIDIVKLVIIDLDDTLWRGVAAESGTSNIEGWPLGFIEALSFLKKRGVLLAIVSKNDESRILEIWNDILGDRLSLSDFAVCYINWSSKVDNIAAILSQVNLLPESTVFIDDNPIETAAVQAAFPGIRTLGSDPYYLKRVLLWSSETQNVVITDESARRTEMIQSQVKREDIRGKLNRADFLESLNLRISISKVSTREDKRFPRALELINKTNQFNTNGERWTAEMSDRHFARGGVFFTFEVRDDYARYGLVGVLIVQDSLIRQFVMSCRVFGLEVEVAAVVTVANQLFDFQYQEIQAQVTETKANVQCRDVYGRCGFTGVGGNWTVSRSTIVHAPTHITVKLDP